MLGKITKMLYTGHKSNEGDSNYAPIITNVRYSPPSDFSSIPLWDRRSRTGGAPVYRFSCRFRTTSVAASAFNPYRLWRFSLSKFLRLCRSAASYKPDHLKELGLITDELLAGAPSGDLEHVDYSAVIPWKYSLLKSAYEQFLTQPSGALFQDFQKFCEEEAFWLDDYALYMSVKDVTTGVSGLTGRNSSALRRKTSKPG